MQWKPSMACKGRRKEDGKGGRPEPIKNRRSQYGPGGGGLGQPALPS